MAKKYHLADQPIPQGFRIYEERLEVMGVTKRRRDLLTFVRARDHSLSFELEPTNPVDPNAIKVIGHWRGLWLRRSNLIGYVPREVAQRLAEAGLAGTVEPRLLKTYASTDDYVEVLFQIIGPSSAFSKYAERSPSYAVKAKAKAASGNEQEAEQILLAAVRSTEAESELNGYGVAPRPYLDLAKLYRKAKRRDDEIAILERYEKQKKAPGRLPAELAERLSKLREA